LSLLLILSVLGLCVGASLALLGRSRAQAASALDAAVLGMVPTLVLARLLPHTFESLGVTCIALAALGCLLADRSVHRHDHHAQRTLSNTLVLPALWLHTLADGAALAVSVSGRIGSSSALVAAAVILHRIPEGLFVASRLQTPDTRSVFLAILPLALSSVLGAYLGDELLNILPDVALDAFLALGAGAMLRLALHTHPSQSGAPHSRSGRALEGLSFVCGVAAVLAIPG